MDELAISEKLKYTKVWDRLPNYSCLSPGEDLAPFYLKKLDGKIKKGDKLLDFGCGTGRAAKTFLFQGNLTVELVDFCGNCLDPGIRLLLQVMPEQCRFWESCLWDLPKELPIGEWGLCCDVMEHIPPEKVDSVLASISSHLTKGGIFSIFLKEDKCGSDISQRLHLTLKPKEWWQESLARHFLNVEFLTGTNDWVIFQVMNAKFSFPI